MATTPTWQAATSGQPALAGHVNQLLGTHKSTLLYTGVQTAAQTTVGTGSVSSNGLYIAQSFATAAAQTAIGYVLAYITSGSATSGSQLGPTTLSLYANSAGAPTGSALVSCTLTAEYVANAPTFVTFPLPITGLTASTTYWLVLAPAGNVTYSYLWYKSNQTSGASTSTNGTSWTAQAYGLLYQIYDQTASGSLVSAWDDSGARWTWTSYNTNGTINQYAEYTAGQTAAGYLQSFRTMAYSNGLLKTIT